MLKILQNKLQPVFSEYLNQETLSIPIESKKNEILQLINDKNIALVSANSSKKKLKSIGLDPRLIIVTGGPLFFEDYKIINPNLSDKALEGIKTKCEKLIYQIKNEDWNEKDLIVIYEKENPTDNLILNRINEISEFIKKKVLTIRLNSWKDLDKY